MDKAFVKGKTQIINFFVAVDDLKIRLVKSLLQLNFTSMLSILNLIRRNLIYHEETTNNQIEVYPVTLSCRIIQ